MKARVLLAALICSPLVLGEVSSVSKPWVDPTKVQGRLLLTGETRVNLGIQTWGTAVDPDGDPVTIALTEAPEGVVLTTDPNGAWSWNWWPTTEGVFYVAMTVTDNPSVGPVQADLTTVAVRVLPVNKPPTTSGGGCKVLTR